MLLLNKYLKTQALLIVLVFLFKNINSQNLIQNPSFENYSSLSCNSAGFDDYTVSGTPHILDYWYGYFTPDYFRNACNNTSVGVPFNHFGYRMPNNGNAYIGLGFYQKGDESKEYVYQQLSSPLEAGKIYCINFFVSRASRSTYAIKNIEVLFSNTLINLTNGYIQANPQIVKQVNFVSDTAIWTQIQGCFTANGGEEYFMIGNFNNNTNTDTLFIGTSNPIPFYGDFSYYYVDDITLIDQSTVGIKDVSFELGEMSVYPNPANDILNINIGNLKENTEIKIYNALGELVLTESLTTQNSSLKTHHLQSGIYFYSILVGEKTIKTDKIVIIK